MKKLLIASVMMAVSHATYAAETKTTAKTDEFAKATQLYEAQNYPAAYQEMQRLANTGNAQAIYNLGAMTQIGQGTAKDEKKALQYYIQASNKGFGKATLVIAHAYLNSGLGFTKDELKYKTYLDHAAKQGSEEAIIEYANILFKQGKPEHDRHAIRLLTPLIRKDYMPAQNLKAVYDLGIGVKNNNPVLQQQAINSIKSLAKKGYAPSLMILGNMLANGDVIDQNLPEAKKIFTTLAQANFPHAKDSLTQVEAAIAAKKTAPEQPKK